jgi:hypothetical protein
VRETGLLRFTHGRQVGKVDRFGRRPHGAVTVDPGEHRLAQVGGAGLSGLGREQHCPHDAASEHGARVLVDLSGREAVLHATEHVEDRLGRGDGLADVDGADNRVREVRAGLDPALLDVVGEDQVELGHFAIDSSWVGGVAIASAITPRTSASAVFQSSPRGVTST